MKFKLLNQDMTSHGGFKWEIGTTYRIDRSRTGRELCTPDVFHFYDSPELADILNPIHADIPNPRLFACKVYTVAHDGLKGGSKSMTLMQELPLPEITLTQKIAFAVLCVKQVYTDGDWNKWADAWLDGSDRSDAAARAAARAVDAACTAARAAYAARAVDAAAYAAADAAARAAYAAYAAADAGINLQQIVKEALCY